DSTLLVTRFMLGTTYLEANDAANGTSELEAAARLDSTSVPTMGLLGYAYAKSGNTRRATDIAHSLEGREGRSGGATAAAARVYVGLGDKARALEFLEKAAAQHDAFFSSESLAESFFDPIRGDPRFAAVVGRVGLNNSLATKR